MAFAYPRYEACVYLLFSTERSAPKVSLNHGATCRSFLRYSCAVLLSLNFVYMPLLLSRPEAKKLYLSPPFDTDTL